MFYILLFDNKAGKKIQVQVDYYLPKNETYFLLESEEKGVKYLTAERYSVKSLKSSKHFVVPVIDFYSLEEMP